MKPHHLHTVQSSETKDKPGRSQANLTPRVHAGGPKRTSPSINGITGGGGRNGASLKTLETLARPEEPLTRPDVDVRPLWGTLSPSI